MACSQRLAAQDSARPPEVIAIPKGAFVMGSTGQEKERAYKLDQTAYGHDRTRQWGWYDNEIEAQSVYLPAYRITRNLITNADYAVFVKATGHRVPDVDQETWDGYRLKHPFSRTRRHAWLEGEIPEGRADHPVVLVSQADARAYAEWLSARTGQRWRLPTAAELEKAARGTDGRSFPWGNNWDPTRLNSHDEGPFDTLPVGSFPEGASPFGLLDGAGQVFEWTADPAPGSASGGAGRVVVKGGSWDDSGCGICRPASWHTRPGTLKHILIGFRLVLEGE
jgi:formylglycine-generating enzyme required for sulfatase activity